MAKANAIRRRMEERQTAQRVDVDELLGEAFPDAAQSSETAAAPPPPPPALRIVNVPLEVPLAQHRPEVRQFSHADVVLNPAQGRTLRRLFDALDREHGRLANGRHVASPADCIRWLLDQLGGAS